MKKWKIWLGVLLIFAAGLCIGSVGTGLVLRHKVLAFLDEGPPATQRLLIKRLTHKLDLSPQQQQVVAAKIATTQERILALRGRYQPVGEDFGGASLQVLEGAEHVPGLKEALDAMPKP